MPHRQPMNVSLTPELASFVRAEVASGRYASASEVVRASLRMMVDHAPDRPSAASTFQGTKPA
ncbi:MAG: type II toxin-antitoxin system ParD family antitoxin [Sphingomonas pseudosanguinis]|uniref:type II toxin-antitoxin system ParD family antitoxin n=1 Tax=Sphingomonas pseudosanguinis TaxID=413712 RepID=UPI00391DF919